MELKDYWRTIRRRWRIVVTLTLLAVAAAALLTWQATPMYASQARLIASTSTVDSDVNQANAGNALATERVASYAGLINYYSLAVKVAADLGGGIDPGTLAGSVSAEVVPSTVNMSITAQSPDPVEARDIAQAYAEALSRLVASIESPGGSTSAPIRLTVVDDARINTAPVSPNATRNLGLGLVLGLLLGVGVAVLRELLDTSLRSPADVAAITPVPLLGNIHADTAAQRASGATALAEPTPWAESFRVLRTNMQYVEVDHDKRLFVISSSLPSEGKSTTIVNLAITMAMAGQKVALVECDLRRPRIAERLGLDNAVGTTTVLIGRVKLEDAMQEYADTGLHVLTCGQRPPNPSELLQSQAMKDLMSDLREHYDVVLFDAPPLLPVTDAALLAAQTDGMLAIVRHGKTTADQLRHALERVEAVGGKCVGIVMNLTPSRSRSQTYGYGYGYSYSYAPTDDKSARRVRLRRKPESA